MLALPSALIKKSWKFFFLALILSAIGILIPLIVFGMSTFMAPEWKDECHHGWLDCFHLGKLALTPLVLWACVAMYALDIYRVKNRTRTWIVLGVFLGAIISSLCFVFGVVCHGGWGWNDPFTWFLVAPFYVAVWYSIRTYQLIRATELPLYAYLGALLGSLPFWIGAVVWSRKTFEGLTERPPNACFVVTAASRGHETLVGPFVDILHHGRQHRVNRQLLTFWQFEELWRSRAPGGHAAFRRIYNICGPTLAQHITSPWIADLAYLVLKPLEILARRLVSR